jgi:hypothetical protein
MVRALLVLLAFVAVLLVVALFRDRRSRLARQAAGLRSAFLHGSPLAAPVRPPSLTEVVAGGGLLRFHMPATWVQEPAAGGAMIFRDRSAERRTLRLELQTASWPETVDQPTLVKSFGGSLPEKDRSVESLPNGNVLMKWVDQSRDGARVFVVYRWRLGRPRPPHEVRIAAFSFAVEVEGARDVVVQSDLAAIEREIREAALS